MTKGELDIVCPLGHERGFLDRPGSVRDCPEVGLSQCLECGTVVHSVSLKHLVNYSHGSMRQMTPGLGELDPPSVDRTRRVKFSAQEALGKSSEPTVLDFGCGDGYIVNGLQELGVEAWGIDPDMSASGHTIQSRIAPSLSVLREQTPDLKFDLITMFHVVEHIYDPVAVLSDVASFLKPNGSLVLETPNANDALLVRYECNAFQKFTYWSHHPVLYNEHSLHELLTMVGFRRVLRSGIQRYGLANHLYWLSRGMPGGHEVWEGTFGPLTESEYEQDLVKSGLNDTLLFVASMHQSLVNSKNKL